MRNVIAILVNCSCKSLAHLLVQITRTFCSCKSLAHFPLPDFADKFPFVDKPVSRHQAWRIVERAFREFRPLLRGEHARTGVFSLVLEFRQTDDGSRTP